MAYTLVLVRHGQSDWNKLDRFTGWADVQISQKGEEEARMLGEELRKNGFTFDIAYSSVLRRAIRTMQISLESAHMTWLPVIRSWRLNERHYGGLQGLNKTDAVEQFGEAEVKVWRRAYDVKPPLLSEYDPRFPTNDERYQDIPRRELPIGESLKDTLDRVLPYWEEELRPRVLKGERVIIFAHGNSLRALIKNLENLSSNQVLDLEIPTGSPLIYELREQDLKVIRKYYLHKKNQTLLDKIKEVFSKK